MKTSITIIAACFTLGLKSQTHVCKPDHCNPVNIKPECKNYCLSRFLSQSSPQQLTEIASLDSIELVKIKDLYTKKNNKVTAEEVRNNISETKFEKVKLACFKQ